MSYDEKTVERIRRILSRRRDVTETVMMGGLSFMVGGSMACRVSKRGFLIRVTPDTSESILAMPHVRPAELAGRRMSAFAGIAPEGYRTDAALAAWVQRGVDNALAAGAAKGTRKSPAKKAGKKAPAKARRAAKRAR